ncbi:glycosyltransferase family 2 protein, partial [Candidatus Saccharibacteria bacterium]|nr:glycosyltransferase family 2 protein [Candidatus Saccharibacteria bacterium]
MITTQSAYRKKPFPEIVHGAARQQLGEIAQNALLLLQKSYRRKRRKKLALLLPGHNEELIIADTIKSAIAAGQSKNDIYVVDDASSDKTRTIASRLLGKDHVLTVERSGKALAVRRAIAHFYLDDCYEWLHVADADSVFSEKYFSIYRDKLDGQRYAVAVGFVQSLRGNWISSYRSYVYTYGQHMNRRVQSWLGMISVLPGPITAFRTDILDQIVLSDNSMTEDFDMTLQIHRKKLGKMVFIPQAINYTQDPQSLSDFYKQTMRWFRGFFQGVQQHKVGTKRQRIDLSIGLQLLQVSVLFLQLFVIFPLVILLTHRWEIIPIAIAVDFILCCFLVIASAIVSRRWYVVGVIPYFYVLRAWEILMFYQAFFEVIVLRRYSA